MRNLGGTAIMINHNLVPYILKEYIGRGFFIEKNRRVNKMNILEDIQKRGLIQQITNEEGLQKHLEEKEVKLYCGFEDRKSTRLNSSHVAISYAVICLRTTK